MEALAGYKAGLVLTDEAGQGAALLYAVGDLGGGCCCVMGEWAEIPGRELGEARYFDEHGDALCCLGVGEVAQGAFEEVMHAHRVDAGFCGRGDGGKGGVPGGERGGVGEYLTDRLGGGGDGESV